jgi:hypothetical protein
MAAYSATKDAPMDHVFPLQALSVGKAPKGAPIYKWVLWLAALFSLSYSWISSHALHKRTGCPSAIDRAGEGKDGLGIQSLGFGGGVGASG